MAVLTRLVLKTRQQLLEPSYLRPLIAERCLSANYRQSTALQPPTRLLPPDLTKLQAAAEWQPWVDKYNL